MSSTWAEIPFHGNGFPEPAGPDELDASAVDQTDRSEQGAAEGVELRGARLGDIPGEVNFVVEDDHDALAAGCFVGRGEDGVEDVSRTVGADHRARPHGPGHDDRPIELKEEIQLVGGLLERVRTVRDDHALGLVPVKNPRNDVAEFEDLLRPDVGSRFVAEIEDIDSSDAFQPGNAVHQVLAAQQRDRAAGFRIGAHRDRAAGKNDRNPFSRHMHVTSWTAEFSGSNARCQRIS